jgi:hypothetical protein
VTVGLVDLDEQAARHLEVLAELGRDHRQRLVRSGRDPQQVAELEQQALVEPRPHACLLGGPLDRGVPHRDGDDADRARAQRQHRADLGTVEAGALTGEAQPPDDREHHHALHQHAPDVSTRRIRLCEDLDDPAAGPRQQDAGREDREPDRGVDGHRRQTWDRVERSHTEQVGAARHEADEQDGERHVL